jgi:hypothetical protein
VLQQIGAQGSVSTAAALKAFGLSVASLPNAPVATGLESTLADGTIGVDWTIAHWNSLTKAQRTAVTALLVTPAKGAPAAISGASPPPDLSYLVAAQHARDEIAGSIGRDTGQDIRVVLNSASRAKSSVLAYTVSFDRSWGIAGPAAHCVIYLNPILYRQHRPGLLASVLDHQVFHCFQADDFASVSDYAAAPTWLMQGSAQWVGDSLDPLTDPWWGPYLTDIATPLFQRTFDAVGFFAHMAESGTDPWKYLDAMFSTGSSTAAYSYGADAEFSDTWASSLANQPFGAGWQTSGPGMIDAFYRPSISVVDNGSTVTRTVAPYTNAVVPIDVVADVIDISVSNSLGRLHAADGSEFDGSTLDQAQFCVTTACGGCPNLASLPRLPSGPTWLAVTGDVAGATFTVSGVAATCTACPVGTWVTTSYASSPPKPAADLPVLSGGSGISLTISPEGKMEVDYNGMDPLTVTGPGSGGLVPVQTAVFSGSQSAILSLSSFTQRSGVFVAPTQRIRLEYYYSDALPSVTVNPFGTSGPVDWSCSGSTMTFDVPTGPGSRWSLVRQVVSPESAAQNATEGLSQPGGR